eukprot:GFKZ01008511.1.p2 GENE.GFKZ01008511.1~~GFKZ01008511.1.p2  ORF type:complete len:1138 (+),score=157.14 GFKZ01008511.1:2402-5815(+)
MAHPDMAIVAAFERACQEVQVPPTRATAEQTLHHLTSRPDIIPVALHVAEHTNSTVSRFHAAITIRTASAAQWPSLPTQQRYGPSSLRFRLVRNVVSHPTWTSVERKTMLRTAAFLTRKAYLEEPPQDLDHFIDSVCETAAASAPEAAYSATAACELVELLAEEFMAPTISKTAPLMQREILIQARRKFAQPNGHLVKLLHSAIAALSVLVSSPAHPPIVSREFETRALPALSTIFRVLATDFSQLGNHQPVAEASLDVYAEMGLSGSENLEVVVINSFAKPGWSAVIEQVPVVLRLCFMISRIHGGMQNGDESEVIAKATQIITAIGAISRASYGDGTAARKLLVSLLDGMNEQRWSSSPMGVVRLAYAEVWRRVSCAHGWTSVDRLGGSYMDTFARNTCHELDCAAARLARPDADEDMFSMDVADMLLETWANLALQGDDGTQATEHPLAELIGQVVVHFTRMSLRSTGDHTADLVASATNADIEEDFGFEDMSIADSRLAVAAILSRFVLGRMAPAISQSLLQCADNVFRWQGMVHSNNVPLDFFQEDLYFLVRFAAAVLADEAKGEHPAVPIQFLPTPSDENVPNGRDKPPPYARILLSALFEVAQRETNLLERKGPHCDEASPRVGTAILEGLNRVAATYLVPVNVSTAAGTFAAVGGNVLLANGRNGCFSKAMEGISRRGFEGDVAEAAASLLFTMASGASNYADVRDSPAWQTLLHAGSQAYQTLPAEAVHRVGKSLTLVLGDVVAEGLLIPAYNSLQFLAERRDISADAADRAIATINLLRGAAQCESNGPKTRDALLLSIRAPDGTAATCATALGKTRPDVCRSLVMLANDIVSTCLPSLGELKSRDLITNAITIVRLHSEIVLNFLADTPIEELANDIEEIISLLSEIVGEGTDLDVADAFYYGLSALFPIINESALELPIIGAFFRLTASVVGQHPKNLVMLPPDFCGRILGAIDIRRQTVDSTSEMRTLEAIASLARSRVLEPIQGPSDTVVNSALLEFLNAIFNGVASGSAYVTNLDGAADALLPLLHIKFPGVDSVFADIGNRLLRESGNNPEMRNAVHEFGCAVSQAGSVFGFDNPSARREEAAQTVAVRRRASRSFREATIKFANSARKTLLTAAVSSGVG